jgi:hypothetical protein
MMGLALSRKNGGDPIKTQLDVNNINKCVESAEKTDFHRIRQTVTLLR